MTSCRDDALLSFLHGVSRHVLRWHTDLVKINDELLSVGFDTPALVEVAVLDSREVSDDEDRLVPAMCHDLGFRLPTVAEAATLLGAVDTRRLQRGEIDCHEFERRLLEINSSSAYEAEVLPQLWHEVEWRNDSGRPSEVVLSECDVWIKALLAEETLLLRAMQVEPLPPTNP